MSSDIIVNKYITKNPYFNDGRYLSGSSFKGFFLHSVGCSQPDPLVFVNGWNKSTYTNAGVNGFIGDSKAYITAPCLEKKGQVKRMPHAGSPANNYYIGFEMCEPGCIRYTGSGATFTVTAENLPRAKEYVKNTYNNAVELFATLCKFHGKDPLQDGVILSHAEGAKRGIATNHGDPEHLWNQLNMGYTMDKFRRDVKQRIEDEVDMTKNEVISLVESEVKDQLKPLTTKIDNIAKVLDEIKDAQPKNFKYLKDVTMKYAKPTLDKLVKKGLLKGKSGSGPDMVIDLSENDIRMLVILDRTGVFDFEPNQGDSVSWQER